MTLLVQKYGGTSVASVERIQAVAEKVAASRKAGNQLVVVLSAMSGVTNKLLGWAHQVQADPSARRWMCCYQPESKPLLLCWQWR